MFGTKYRGSYPAYSDSMNPFSASRDDTSSELFDEDSTFVPAHIPTPGPTLEGHDLLEDDDHVRFHEVTRELFEERGVYDVTFGYNLTKLNLDRRHPEAGYRYAIDRDDLSILWAEFTPTTPFCPQAGILTKGSFRAWNGLSDRHSYTEVRVRVHPMHHQSMTVNAELEALEGSGSESESGSGSESGLEQLSEDPPF